MKQRTWMVLLVMAGLGLSACSPSQQIVGDEELDGQSSPPSADEQQKVTNMPSANFGAGYNYSAQMSGTAKAPVPNYHQPPRPAPRVNPPHVSQGGYQDQYAEEAQNYLPPQIPMRNVPNPNELQWTELQKIGEKIFKNESGGDPNKLVHWNIGEDFASMGIGHFTWYPAGRSQRFGSTFPDLVRYMQQHGAPIPAILLQNPQYAPWRTRLELMQAKNQPAVRELQEFLFRTRDLQAKFIVERAQRAMPRLVKASPGELRPKVAANLNAVANTPGGWYALIDYVNFKGEGLNRTGGYRGQNWGLLQVLESMQPAQPGQAALHSFADSAMYVLQRRVSNSPSANGEARWLAGWSNRINTYRNPLLGV